MFKRKQCCKNPDYEVIEKFFTYKDNNQNNNVYPFQSYTKTTTFSIPIKILDDIVEASKNATIEEIQTIINNKLNFLIEENNKKKRSYVELQKCKNCGYIKKVEIKL